MGARAPRITALLESLRARRPSGLPADDALEGRRRSGPRAAGRVQRGGASASDRRWVYSCRGRGRGGRAVALAHRRPAGETRPRSPPPLSLQHSRLAPRAMNSMARSSSSCCVLRSGGGLRMRFQRSCRGFLQRWLAEAGSFALALRRNGVFVCATARWPRLARRIGSRPGNYWMRRLLRGMLAAIWLSPPSSAPALRMLRGSPQSWQPADGRASSCPLEGSQLCLSLARDRCAYVFRSLAMPTRRSAASRRQ